MLCTGRAFRDAVTGICTSDEPREKLALADHDCVRAGTEGAICRRDGCGAVCRLAGERAGHDACKARRVASLSEVAGVALQLAARPV